VISWWVKPFEGEKGLFKPGYKKVIHFVLFISSMFLVFSPWLVDGLNEGVQLKLLLGFGITSITTQAQLNIPHLLVWVLLYACYFILVAAPVLHLLISSLWQVDYSEWRDNFGRWIFQVLALMTGFYAAVTRHSWRAYYNADLPSAIMGRYLIVFSVVFFIVAVISADHFEPEKFKSSKLYILMAQILPFGLVTFAYFALIEGAVVRTDGDLFKLLGSVDGFFTEILGPWYFLLVFLLYAITNWLLFKKKKKLAVNALILGITIYYAVGLPMYFGDLMEYQTYPYLAKQIVRMLPAPDPKSGEVDKVTVFLPEVPMAKSRSEIYNGLRTRGYNATIIKKYSEEAVSEMITEKGFIIVSLPDELSQQDLPVYEINDLEFQIIQIEK
jgi:hypothetical protein